MPKLTPVQRRVLDGLLAMPGRFAMIGRGLPFKCNRITARSLRDLGLVAIEGSAAPIASRADEVPFRLTLTAAGVASAAATDDDAPDDRDPAADQRGLHRPRRDA